MPDGTPIDWRVIFERDAAQHGNDECYKTIMKFVSSLTVREVPCKNNKKR